MGERISKLIVDSLVIEDSNGPRLRGSRCRQCATINFPSSPFCSNPDCVKDRRLIEEWTGGPNGTLWSWTVQEVRAMPPFRYDVDGPYAVGMVDLPEGIRVLGLLTEVRGLRHDMPVRLTLGELYEDSDGAVTTWMWAPTS